ncbi:thioredoxin family protein [Desulfobacter hydrogenophilus]|uniref:Thioredoxin family protein n=1 Tax=Desulfobacter hydrogenophilus TaxID=2291 RepID=A0A328F8B9_9BACT|nr:thioredoxin family protein [Desulfobacter hydrogenophilus]NDY73651.1 thioredoxin family protein [Desulfobacter hydrogenophilus]QBH14929.1 thioredoxin family protein [Desulfobacter hydrogenophilus]RAM00589.1 thioredoxin family protein [Desulfobacter hydrogenophilus]
MRKESILVGILVVMVLGGIYLYNRSASDLGIQVPQLNIEPRVAEHQTPQSSSTAASNDISWNDYTPGMALAGEEGKNIFLYFHASWCGYCTKLKKETFTDDRIKAYLNDHFVSIGVDTEKREKLARQWGVRGLPTLWFLEPDGTKINSLPGFANADQLLSILQYIHTQSYKNMSYQEYVQQKKS